MENGGHAMVLYGADVKMNNLIVADPYSTGGDYGSAHTEYFKLNKFRGTIQPVQYALKFSKIAIVTHVFSINSGSL
jgi:hypothetical protein